MDRIRSAWVVVALGVVLMGYGAFGVLSNRPEAFDRSRSEVTILGRDDLGNLAGVRSRNFEREIRRRAAGRFLAVGGLVVCLGAAVATSTARGSGVQPSRPIAP